MGRTRPPARRAWASGRGHPPSRFLKGAAAPNGPWDRARPGCRRMPPPRQTHRRIHRPAAAFFLSTREGACRNARGGRAPRDQCAPAPIFGGRCSFAAVDSRAQRGFIVQNRGGSAAKMGRHGGHPSSRFSKGAAAPSTTKSKNRLHKEGPACRVRGDFRTLTDQARPEANSHRRGRAVVIEGWEANGDIGAPAVIRR